MSAGAQVQVDWLAEPAGAGVADARPSAPIPSKAAEGAAPVQSSPVTSVGKLWLCLQFSDLPLEVQPEYDPQTPLAVTTVVRQRVVVMAVSPAARACGVEPGLHPAAAQAMCPELRLERRDEPAEARRLDALARWAMRWSSWISVSTPDRLLLEVGGSRRLFGGLQALQQRVVDELSGQGHAVQTAMARSARAAAWLAPWVSGAVAEDEDATRRLLAALPVEALGLSSKGQTRLQRAGLHHLGQLMRLPRDGLARRYGAGVLRELDEALGQRPEAMPRFSPPERFVAELELPMPESATPRLRAAAEHLIEQLVRYLRGHDAAVDCLRLRLFHERQPASRLDIGLAMAGRDPVRIGRVLAEHLDRLGLPEPVRSLRLEAPRIVSLAAGTQDWLDSRGDDDWLATLELWQSRLGAKAVQGLSARADYRPEAAWVQHPPGAVNAACPPVTAPRPMWLLREPQAMVVRHHQPTYNGPLIRESGPERIEQGWWDTTSNQGGDICRDYYVMRDRFGARLWVFQDRQRLGWWLHGHFA